MPILLALCISALVLVWTASASVAAPNADTPSTTAANAKASPSDRFAGVLDFPTRLKAIPNDTGLAWTDPTVDFRKYDKIRIGDIQARADVDKAPLDAKSSQKLADDLRQSLLKLLPPAYKVVETSGPGVLRVRITIMDVVETRAETDSAEQTKPSAAPPGAVAIPEGSGAPYLGHSDIAVQFFDDARNVLVGEYLEAHIGPKYIFGKQAAAARNVPYVETFSTWDYVKNGFDAWSQQFPKQLDRLKTS